MREFKDGEGRPWRLALTIGAALRVRDMVSHEIEVETEDDNGKVTKTQKVVPFDIGNADAIGHTFAVLRSQFTKTGEVLYAILCQQIADRSLTRDQFLDSLTGDSMDDATKALESELFDFFPRRLRRMLQMMTEKMDTVGAEMQARAEAQIAAANAETLIGQSGKQFGKPPESSDATPANSLSDNFAQPATVG